MSSCEKGRISIVPLIRSIWSVMATVAGEDVLLGPVFRMTLELR
jgi:hypothetical protein